MKICISGISGFTGSYLQTFFTERGDEVVGIYRKDFESPEQLIHKLEGSGVLIHLTGSPVIQRWTSKNRKQIFESRILTSQKLVSALCQCVNPPDVFISASAVGIYSSAGVHTESEYCLGTGFMAEICQAWEEAVSEKPEGVRLVNIRMGIVLGRGGGMLSKILPLFRYGLGGRLGSGHQAFPWIHIDDFSQAILFIIQTNLSGPINLVSPATDNSQTFTRALASVVKRPAVFSVPSFIIRLIFGKAAISILDGQSVIPQKLLEAGFEFQHPDLQLALKESV
ncbi:MAG: TIGR01777 family oxidoreductase [Bacteroidales bacterium]|jgi:uncharacterized protein (TIGR01777 family)|nr:TIGR01777 family oxidoreductase [Bacteroidales bacterium]